MLHGMSFDLLMLTYILGKKREISKGNIEDKTGDFN